MKPTDEYFTASERSERAHASGAGRRAPASERVRGPGDEVPRRKKEVPRPELTPPAGAVLPSVQFHVVPHLLLSPVHRIGRVSMLLYGAGDLPVRGPSAPA